MAPDLLRVRLRDHGPIELFHCPLEDVKLGAQCIVSFDRGQDYGTVLAYEPAQSADVPERQRAVRLCDAKDLQRIAQNRTDADARLAPCREAIAARKLPMKLIAAEYTYDHSKIVFYFAADDRVDFRDLVRDLAKALKARIELRQIGIRDETRVLGALACCGRVTCCRSWMQEFVPVNIRMAKLQQIQLHPAKLSGVCNRLKCCLAYEDEAYRALQETLPLKGQRVRTPQGTGDVIDVQLLLQQVTVRFDDESVRVLPGADVTVVSRSKTRAKVRARKRRLPPPASAARTPHPRNGPPPASRRTPGSPAS